jgi:hypothetical protein
MDSCIPKEEEEEGGLECLYGICTHDVILFDPYLQVVPTEILWLKLFTISFLFKFVIVDGREQLVLALQEYSP